MRSNPRTPAGCDRYFINDGMIVMRSNPRTPAGCDRKYGLYFDRQRSSNPRTPAGCDTSSSRNGMSSRVPIHAPPRGATCSEPFDRTDGQFQSTHPRGVRRKRQTVILARKQFQSTHPRGVRRFPGELRTRLPCSNPRTPAGCDQAARSLRPAYAVPIHAPPRGATNIGSACHSTTAFQSTHPRGVRQ